MTGAPINLNKARKARAKAAAKAQADRNAAFHGLTKAQKAQARAEAELEARRQEGGRLRGSEATGDGSDD
jgi:hypothetical protein